MTAPETVNFHGTDIITSSGIGDGSYLVRILAPNISNGLQIQDCTQAAGGGCINGVAHGALPSVHTIQLNPNTVYYVDEETNTYNGALTGNGATAEIDGAFLSLWRPDRPARCNTARASRLARMSQSPPDGR